MKKKHNYFQIRAALKNPLCSLQLTNLAFRFALHLMGLALYAGNHSGFSDQANEQQRYLSFSQPSMQSMSSSALFVCVCVMIYLGSVVVNRCAVPPYVLIFGYVAVGLHTVSSVDMIEDHSADQLASAQHREYFYILLIFIPFSSSSALLSCLVFHTKRTLFKDV